MQHLNVGCLILNQLSKVKFDYQYRQADKMSQSDFGQVHHSSTSVSISDKQRFNENFNKHIKQERMEGQLKYSSPKYTVIDQISDLNSNDRLQLFEKIRISREQRLRKIMDALKQQEKEVMASSDHKRQTKMVERAFRYTPSKILQAHVPVRMQQCFHFLFFDQSNKNEEKEEQTCSICVKDFEEDQKVTQLSCNHHFHTECIESWFNNRVNCPNCRQQPGQLIDPSLKMLTQIRDKGVKIARRNNLMLQKMKNFLMEGKKNLY